MPNRRAMAFAMEPEGPVPVFNAEQWARDHQARDDERHETLDKNVTNVWRVLAFAGVTLVAVLGWSLQAQYANASKTLDAIQRVQTAVVQQSAVSKAAQ